MISHFDYHPKQSLLAFTPADSTSVLVYDLNSRKCLHKTASKSLISTLQFDHKGKRLFFGTENGSGQTLNVATGKVQTFKNLHSGRVLGSTLKRDQDFILTSGEDRLVKKFSWNHQETLIDLRPKGSKRKLGELPDPHLLDLNVSGHYCLVASGSKI